MILFYLIVLAIFFWTSSGGESAVGPAASGPTPSRFLMQQELRERIRDAIK